MNLFPCSTFVDDPKDGQSLTVHAGIIPKNGTLQNRLGKPMLFCTNCIITLWFPTYGYLGGITILPLKLMYFSIFSWSTHVQLWLVDGLSNCIRK